MICLVVKQRTEGESDQNSEVNHSRILIYNCQEIQPVICIPIFLFFFAFKEVNEDLTRTRWRGRDSSLGTVAVYYDSFQFTALTVRLIDRVSG